MEIKPLRSPNEDHHLHLFFCICIFNFLIKRDLCKSNKNSALYLSGHEDHCRANTFVQWVRALNLVTFKDCDLNGGENYIMIQYRKLEGDWVHPEAKDTEGGGKESNPDAHVT